MPKFVVTQTQAEYSAYQKAQDNEADRRGWYGVIIALIGSPVLWWLLWHLHLMGLL